MDMAPDLPLNTEHCTLNTHRIVMMGTGTFAEPTFEALLAARENVVGLVTQPERESNTRKSGSTRQTGKGMLSIIKALPVMANTHTLSKINLNQSLN